MAAAAMQGVDQHIRSSLGFSILPKDTSTCSPGESNQRPSDNKALPLPLSHSRLMLLDCTYCWVWLNMCDSTQLFVSAAADQFVSFTDLQTEVTGKTSLCYDAVIYRLISYWSFNWELLALQITTFFLIKRYWNHWIIDFRAWLPVQLWNNPLCQLVLMA